MYNYLKSIEKRIVLLLLLNSIMLVSNSGQVVNSIDSVSYSIESYNSISSGENLPFWLYSNKQGLIPNSPINSLILGKIENYDTDKKTYQLGYHLSGGAKIDNSKVHSFIHFAYLDAYLYFLKIECGIKPVILGNQSNTLTSGGYLFSGNSPSFPTLEISIPNYVALPYTKQKIEIKGNIGNGFINDNPYVKNFNLHYKSGFVKLGGSWPVTLNYGFIHAVQWGGISNKYGRLPSNFDDFLNAFVGNAGDSDSPLNEQLNALGNHVASQNIGIELKYKEIKINCYWQNFYDDAPIQFILKKYYQTDRLFGLTVENSYLPFISKVLFEYFNSTDQSGPYHDKDGVIFGGNDNYFNNFVYVSGWSLKGFTIGSPLITSPKLLGNSFDGFINNRVQAYHFGFSGNLSNLNYKLLLTQSKNYGTYYKPFYKENISTLLEVSKTILKYNFSLAIAYDNGDLFGNSFGVSFGIKKSFIVPAFPYNRPKHL